MKISRSLIQNRSSNSNRNSDSRRNRNNGNQGEDDVDELGVTDHVHDVDEDDDESMIYDEDDDSVVDSGDEYEDEDTIEEVAVNKYGEPTENRGPVATTTTTTTTNTTNEQIVMIRSASKAEACSDGAGDGDGALNNYRKSKRSSQYQKQNGSDSSVLENEEVGMEVIPSIATTTITTTTTTIAAGTSFARGADVNNSIEDQHSQATNMRRRISFSLKEDPSDEEDGIGRTARRSSGISDYSKSSYNTTDTSNNSMTLANKTDEDDENVEPMDRSILLVEELYGEGANLGIPTNNSGTNESSVPSTRLINTHRMHHRRRSFTSAISRPSVNSSASSLPSDTTSSVIAKTSLNPSTSLGQMQGSRGSSKSIHTTTTSITVNSNSGNNTTTASVASVITEDNDFNFGEYTRSAADYVAQKEHEDEKKKHITRYSVNEKVLVNLSFLNMNYPPNAILPYSLTLNEYSHQFNASGTSVDAKRIATNTDAIDSKKGTSEGKLKRRKNALKREDSSITSSQRHLEEDLYNSIEYYCTIEPVNKYGYPKGKGYNEHQKKGPHVYVLATVKKVHFDETARYYTVERADTKTEQRADTEWMERIVQGSEGEKAAQKAATMTRDRMIRKQKLTTERGRSYKNYPLLLCYSMQKCFHKIIGSKLQRCWHYTAFVAVQQSRQFLYGSKPYACTIQCTGINFLVACSFIFVFIDQFRLAFIPVESDSAILVLAIVVWCFLTAELALELLIRPKGYKKLILSEKGYAPSTARYLNRFHLITESACLLFFGIEIALNPYGCGNSKEYPHTYTREHFTASSGNGWNTVYSSSVSFTSSFSLLASTMNTTLGPTGLHTALGMVYFAVLRFRIFSLVRHWKNMWLNHTFIDATGTSNKTWKSLDSFIYGYFLPHKGNANIQHQYLSNNNYYGDKNNSSIGDVNKVNQYNNNNLNSNMNDYGNQATNTQNPPNNYYHPNQNYTNSSNNNPPNAVSPQTNEDGYLSSSSNPMRRNRRRHGNESIQRFHLSASEEDRRLTKAATIGTALMIVNSHRAMLLL